jgi:hypothetical protein
MKNAKVVLLGPIRELLAEWDRVRDGILAGQVKGWATTLMDESEGETVFLGGIYKTDPEKATRAALRQSAARMLLEDPPLKSVS